MFKKKGDTPSILTDELFVSPCMLDRLPELLEARVGFGELWDKHYNQIWEPLFATTTWKVSSQKSFETTKTCDFCSQEWEP